eukprot:TRINITY_DN40660_c0_g1_i1.p1 TRINITY_DN40660_c0_g1~~TRINITY_DN40660_c0_g1_i1.p1  ORF type:complete len:275 (-),score=31.18 TRINITY_DN40660_c0_g1_i1:77-901(-)
MASFSHIPKRAVQHGQHTPSMDVAPTSLKPGQTELHRTGLYTTEANAAKDILDVEPAMVEDRQPASEYGKRVSNATAVKDYLPANLAKPTRRAEQDQGDHKSAAHWKTEYTAVSTESASRRATPRLTAAKILEGKQKPTPRSCTARGEVDSCYAVDFGRHGSDPRNKMDYSSDKMPVIKSVLTAGTPQGTLHAPGYQGFIPSYPGFNKDLNRIANGETIRSTDKTNIVQIFHTNLVGYDGHTPASVLNDHGPFRQTNLTVFGRDFQPHKTGALK